MRTVVRACAMLLLAGILTLPALAEPQNAREMDREVQALLRQYETLGKKDFETTWPDGKPKEKYTVSPDGVVSYSKMYQAGNFAIKYQRKVDGVVSYERWHGNGQAAVVCTRDPRITAWTSYWPSGVVREKFQSNRHSKDMFYLRYDENGKQVIPRPTP